MPNQLSSQLVKQSIELLPEQCLEAWNGAKSVNFPDDYQKIQNVVVAGMGGSGLPTHFITSVCATRVPVQLVNGYNLPYWAREGTLVFLASYSGNTEETLSCAEQAQRHHCFITGISSGGKLGRWLEENRYPAYIFKPVNNPSGKPRLGIGYMIFGELALLNILKLIVNIGPSIEEDVVKSIAYAKQGSNLITRTSEKTASNLRNKLTFIFAADHLVGNAHILANQLNETSKSLALWYVLPEANHHLMEGLKHPDFPKTGIFLESNMYLERVKKRFKLTRELFEKGGNTTAKYQPQGETVLTEALGTLLFSSWLSYYLSKIYKENPLLIPMVDWFKEQLEKR